MQGCLPVVLMFDVYESEEKSLSSCELSVSFLMYMYNVCYHMQKCGK